MSKGKVLFIDDDSFLRKVYQAELHDKGFDVALAVDGEDGMQKIAALQPDCIILDLIMPKKNGFEVLTDLDRSETLRSIPVIILSNLAQSDDQKRALDLGAVDYLVKDNTTLDIIAEKIEYHMQVGKGEQTARAVPQAVAKPQAVAGSREGTILSAASSASGQRKIDEAMPRTHAKKEKRSHNFCPACGTKLAAGAKFCPECGAAQQ